MQPAAQALSYVRAPGRKAGNAKSFREKVVSCKKYGIIIYNYTDRLYIFPRRAEAPGRGLERMVFVDKMTPHTQSSLHISQEVVSTVAQEAIRELDGVAGLSNLPAKSGLFASPASARPVRIALSGDVAQIDIGIVLYGNARLKDVCERVQSVVKDAVQNMTGVTVSKVNVHVVGTQEKTVGA